MKTETDLKETLRAIAKNQLRLTALLEADPVFTEMTTHEIVTVLLFFTADVSIAAGKDCADVVGALESTWEMIAVLTDVANEAKRSTH